MSRMRRYTGPRARPRVPAVDGLTFLEPSPVTEAMHLHDEIVLEGVLRSRPTPPPPEETVTVTPLPTKEAAVTERAPLTDEFLWDLIDRYDGLIDRVAALEAKVAELEASDHLGGKTGTTARELAERDAKILSLLNSLPSGVQLNAASVAASTGLGDGVYGRLKVLAREGRIIKIESGNKVPMYAANREHVKAP